MLDTRSAAPGQLETVRRFVNTRDIEAGTDTLTGHGRLRSWLLEASLLPTEAQVAAADVAHALAVREALRSVLAANHDDVTIPADVVAVLNEAADRASMRVAFTADQGWVTRTGAGGVDGALGELLIVVGDAMSDRTWSRLKVCSNDACRWAFYDHSRARSGRWCTMRLCGNRAKQQAWRARRS